jgi:hypothetical protein
MQYRRRVWLKGHYRNWPSRAHFPARPQNVLMSQVQAVKVANTDRSAPPELFQLCRIKNAHRRSLLSDEYLKICFPPHHIRIFARRKPKTNRIPPTRFRRILSSKMSLRPVANPA